jgi:hypothetical protein
VSEDEYDKEIAPMLLAVGERCRELGYPMVAVVEYGPDQRAETRALQEGLPSLPISMLMMLAKHGNNIDGFLINLIRHCKAHGIDMRQSMFLTKYAATKEQPHDQ